MLKLFAFLLTVSSTKDLRIEIKIADLSRYLSQQYKPAVNGVSLYQQSSTFQSANMLETEDIHYDDKRILIADFTPGTSSSLLVEKKAPGLAMLFMLSGRADIYSEKIYLTSLENQYIVFLPGKLSLLIEAECPLKFVVLTFDETTVSELFDEPGVTLPQPLPLIPTLIANLNSIVDCEHTGYSRRLFYEAKMLEILLSVSDWTKRFEQNRFLYIKTYDLDKIYQAKEFIEQNIQSPCSLIELAHKVGLNDFKLKRGFKEVVGTTVFGYLHDFRMEKARRLLEKGSPVNEVSYEVGYKNPHHFTAAFKKKYGMLPSSLKRQNKHFE